MLHCNKCHRKPQSFDDVAPAVVKFCIYLQIGERGERGIRDRSGYKLAYSSPATFQPTLLKKDVLSLA